ncbi:hypothetical protein F5X97DRAFT_329798 [Nemania serpens]|nr:hypothetical protein F5X97DRAFT_329798 [Nemania serpens]
MHPQEYVKKMALLALFFGFAIAAPLALVEKGVEPAYTGLTRLRIEPVYHGLRRLRIETAE